MLRPVCVCLALTGLAANHAAAQCSSIPTQFLTPCTELQGYLNAFGKTIASQWNGARTTVAFGGELTTADANRGLQVLRSPNTMAGVNAQLDGLANPGAAARGRGLKVVVETSVLFPNYAGDLPLSAYYATLSAEQLTAGRAQVAQTIAQQLQPDWLNLGPEPDTQSALLGLSTEYTPQQYASEISTIVSQLRTAGVSAKPLVAAGIGSWQTNGSAYLQALTATGLDFTDFHIYSVNFGFLAVLPSYIDMAHAAAGAALRNGNSSATGPAYASSIAPPSMVTHLAIPTPSAAATLPGNATLPNGMGTFQAALSAPRPQTITATDTVTASIAGTSNTIAVSANGGTMPAGVSPANGSGLGSTMTFTFADARGWQDLDVVNVLINSVLDGRHACYLAYSRTAGVLYLVNDAGTGLSAGLVLSAPGSVANSQCAVSGQGSSVSGSGTRLTLAVSLTFSASFAGNQVDYLAARDVEGGNSGWQALGVWNVPGPPVTGPGVSGMIPARSSGLRQTYNFTFTDTFGWQDIPVANVLIASAIDGAGACYLALVPSGAGTASLDLVDNAGDAGGPYAGMLLPGSGTISNSQCTITGTGSGLITSGNTLTLTLTIEFAPGFAGNQIVYAAARSNALNSGWQAVGTITVQDNDVPAISALAPSSAQAGSGSVALTVTGGTFRVNAPCAAICGFACPQESVVNFDGVPIATQYMGPTQLLATVPASLLAAPHFAAVTVNNPVLIECQGTESHVSGSLPFAVGQ